MLSWTVAELIKHRSEPFQFNATLDLKATLIERDPEIIDASKVTVDGQVLFDDGDFIVDVTLAGKLVVPSTRSLKPVDWPLDFTFSEVYVRDPANKAKYEEGQLVIDLAGDELDLMPAVIDHILLSIPMQVLTPEEEASGLMPTGTDWAVIPEADEPASDEKPNPAFAKLKDLFPDDENDENSDKKK